MTRRFALAAVCAVALAATGFAQKKPDFSGTWVIDQSAAEGGAATAGAGRGAPGGEMIITQTGGTFTVDRKGPSGTQSTTYKLDGTEQQVMSGQLKMKARPRWDGDKIAIDLTRPTQDGTMFTTTIFYSMDKEGRLTIDMPSPMGARKTVYKKKPAETPKVIPPAAR
jgi:hypothetical protein